MSLSGTSDVNGEVLFSNVPAGSGYTLTTTKSGQTVTLSPTVVGGTTTTTVVTMPTVTVVGTVTWVGANVNGATVTLAGGPMSLSTLTATTNSSGQVTFTNVPAGGAYTLTASKNGQTTTLSEPDARHLADHRGRLRPRDGNHQHQPGDLGRQERRRRDVHDLGWAEFSVTYTGTLNASGAASAIVPAATSAYPYTVTVTLGGGTGTATVSSLASGSTAIVSPVMTPTGTISINAATWVGKPAGGASYSITGGPLSSATFGGTLDASGVGSVVVPVTTSAAPYTVSVSKNGGTGPRR